MRGSGCLGDELIRETSYHMTCVPGMLGSAVLDQAVLVEVLAVAKWAGEGVAVGHGTGRERGKREREKERERERESEREKGRAVERER